MSAETSSRSPTSRLTGKRPPSTAGRTRSIRIGRRAFAALASLIATDPRGRVSPPRRRGPSRSVASTTAAAGCARVSQHEGRHAAEVERRERLRQVRPVHHARPVGEEEVVDDPGPEPVGEDGRAGARPRSPRARRPSVSGARIRSQIGRRSRTPWRKPTSIRSGSTAPPPAERLGQRRRRSRTGSEPRRSSQRPRSARRARTAPRPRGPPSAPSGRRARRGDGPAAAERAPVRPRRHGRSPRAGARTASPAGRDRCPRRPARGRRTPPAPEHANSSAIGCAELPAEQPAHEGRRPGSGSACRRSDCAGTRRSTSPQPSFSTGSARPPGHSGGVPGGLGAQHQRWPAPAPPARAAGRCGPRRSTRARRRPASRAGAVRHPHDAAGRRAPSASCAAASSDAARSTCTSTADCPARRASSPARMAAATSASAGARARRGQPHRDVGGADPRELRRRRLRGGRSRPRSPQPVRWASRAR